MSKTLERIIEVAQMVQDDCDRNSKKIDGMPFDGKTVGPKLGEILAMVKANAAGVEALSQAMMPPTGNGAIPTVGENPNGLHQRYCVLKADGSEVDPGALYFVLRLDDGGSDAAHVAACQAAARAYATNILGNSMAGHLHKAAGELRNLVAHLS